MKLREYNSGDARRVESAISHLRQARELLKRVGVSRRATNRVRGALSSLMGARRHIYTLRFLHLCPENNHRLQRIKT